MYKKTMKKILYTLLGISIAIAGSVSAVNVSIPQATQVNQIPLGQSTGNYTPTPFSTVADVWEATKTRWASSSSDYWLTTKSTTNLSEGTNLYFTPYRFVENFVTNIASTTANWGGTWQTHAPAYFQTALGFTPISNALTKGNFIVGNDAGVAQATSSLFISSTGNIGISTTSPINALSMGLNKNIALYSNQQDDAGERLILQNNLATDGTDSAKSIIAFKNITGDSVAWITAHKYSSASSGGALHEHMSLETSMTNGGLYSRFILPYNCDYQCYAQLNQVDLTINNNSGHDNGRLFLQNDVFHSGSFQFFPNGGYSSSTINNRTYGLQISNNLTGATTTELSALGDTKLYINDSLIVKTGNKLGVGTTSPVGLIEANYSDTNTTVTTGNANAIRIVNPATTNNSMGELSFVTNDTTGTALRTSAILGINTSHTQNVMSGDIAFITRNAGSYTEKMRILGSGNVGIGTTSPATALDVNGTTTMKGLTVTENGTSTIPFLQGTMASITTFITTTLNAVTGYFTELFVGGHKVYPRWSDRMSIPQATSTDETMKFGSCLESGGPSVTIDKVDAVIASTTSMTGTEGIAWNIKIANSTASGTPMTLFTSTKNTYSTTTQTYSTDFSTATIPSGYCYWFAPTIASTTQIQQMYLNIWGYEI